MSKRISRRKFLGTSAATGVVSTASRLLAGTDSSQTSQPAKTAERILDMHVHFDDANPHFVDELLKVCERLNMTACVLTPFANRKTILDAARQHPQQIIPFGSVDLDAPDVVQQVTELHASGFRGLGEMEFVKKPFNDPAYFPVYEFADRQRWIMLFHTGIVLRRRFDEPEDVASWRMRPLHLDEIARRFPRITVLGAHCGNPEYEWAAETARWNPNVFWDFSGSTLTKMHGRLGEIQKYFWWSSTDWHSAEWKVKTPNNDPNAFIKVVFGSDTGLSEIETVVQQYRAMFDACDVPPRTRDMIMGGTMRQLLGLKG